MAQEIINTKSIESVRDLELAGFTPEQVRRLEVLKEDYHPLIEIVESTRQWQRIKFLRWLYQNGAYPKG